MPPSGSPFSLHWAPCRTTALRSFRLEWSNRRMSPETVLGPSSREAAASSGSPANRPAPSPARFANARLFSNSRGSISSPAALTVSSVTFEGGSSENPPTCASARAPRTPATSCRSGAGSNAQTTKRRPFLLTAVVASRSHHIPVAFSRRRGSPCVPAPPLAIIAEAVVVVRISMLCCASCCSLGTSQGELGDDLLVEYRLLVRVHADPDVVDPLDRLARMRRNVHVRAEPPRRRTPRGAKVPCFVLHVDGDVEPVCHRPSPPI